MQIFKSRVWEPITLRNGGLFHLAFGAILTGHVFTENKRGE